MMRKGICALAWTAVFCFLIATASFAADETKDTAIKTKQQRMQEFQKKKAKKLEDSKKEKPAADAGTVQKQEEQKQMQVEKKQTQTEKKQQQSENEQMQEEQKQQKKELKDINKGTEDKEK
jgi:flagellar motor protein MotB